jgi:MoaE-MoaD fusion protein
VIVPLDLIALGTIAATDELLAELDDEVDVVFVVFLLLLPQPTATTLTHTTARDAANLSLHLPTECLLKPAQEHRPDARPQPLAFRYMVVRIRLFAALRERAGSDEIELELPEGALVSDALERMGGLTGGMKAVLAVNREYAPAHTALQPGDEIALIPPVSGGASPSGTVQVRLTIHPIALDPLLAAVRDSRAGAVVIFEGVTREVPQLEYEAYGDMAVAKITEVVETAVQRHGLCAVAAEHRVGTVPLSESSVVVAVSAPHRAEAFAGAREIIDRLKAEAPIWKQEEGEWVQGAPPVTPT